MIRVPVTYNQNVPTDICACDVEASVVVCPVAFMAPVLAERLKKELGAERREGQHLRTLLRLADDTARIERQEKERLQTEVCRLQQLLSRHEERGRKVDSFKANNL